MEWSKAAENYGTVQVGENTLRNVHLRPFRAAVDGGCATVMAAFTDVDGVPMHAHGRLIREVLKGEWGFDGVVVADWDGVGRLVNQGVATDLRDAAAQAITAGVDIDTGHSGCPLTRCHCTADRSRRASMSPTLVHALGARSCSSTCAISLPM